MSTLTAPSPQLSTLPAITVRLASGLATIVRSVRLWTPRITRPSSAIADLVRGYDRMATAAERRGDKPTAAMFRQCARAIRETAR